MGNCAIDSPVPPDIIERRSLCFSRPQPGMVVQGGDDDFKAELSRLYSPAESNAAEQLVNLKESLRKADSDSFWRLLAEGLATIADAQYAFVSKRILADDKNVAVEMPPIGEPGACLMGAAFYLNDGHGLTQELRNFKYHAYSCPCAFMRHDKIFIIPEKLNDFIVNNPNPLVVPGEAYLGIPLFADGKCFAHFGVMWSKEGADRRALGWGYLELLFHSLEDLILERVLEGSDFAKSAEPVHEKRPRVIPNEAISVTQSLKPYARSLSHELRTPMQGVVGMLDVMMANVKEAAEGQNDPQVRRVLQTLKENIEAVQDSSRRAVEAADNVVHAYEMNMGVPETPLSPLDNIFLLDKRPDIVVTGHDIPINQFRGMKRRREEMGWASAKQARVSRVARQRPRHSFSEEPSGRTSNSAHRLKGGLNIDQLEKSCSHAASDLHCDSDSTSSPLFASEHSVAPGLRHTDLRELLRYVINDSLKVGGRPDSAIAEETVFGERIEVRTRSSSGQANTKMIEWMVTPDVPETILIDEKDLAKIVSCVALNAIKFTESGDIKLKATLSTTKRYIVVNVKDTGSGIPAAFRPNLFKPFCREDDSTTRQSEGLGLGLMVARGLARKLGGDLYCVYSSVDGPKKGSEFEMRIPCTPGEVCSRPGSPFGSPTPSVRSRLSADADVAPFTGAQPLSTPPLTSEPIKNGEKMDMRGSPAPVTAPYNLAPSLEHLGLPSPRRTASPARPRATSKGRTLSDAHFDRNLAAKYPLNFLVVEDNKINRKLLTSMLQKLGYTNVVEAYDGNDAVEQMRKERPASEQIDVVLMDLWMPLLDGFQATEAILKMKRPHNPTILAVSADITDGALERAAKAGMKGFLTKPFQIRDLEKLIFQHCATMHETAAPSV